MKKLIQLLCGLLVVVIVYGQETDLAAIHLKNEDEVSLLLFENQEESFRKTDDHYTLRAIEFAENHPQLNLSGDFDGDGLDEIAVFTDLKYTPNMNPAFTCSVIKIYKSSGEVLRPHNTWFSTLDTHLDFGFVSYSLAADFNKDGLCDIALIYNDPLSEQQVVYVLESDGKAFSDPLPYYSTIRTEFNFTFLSFACAGDFNGNSQADIALFYNYFGTAPDTKQSIFILESDGSAFTLLPAAYVGIKEEYDFSEMKFSLAGDYNQDGNSDLAVVREDEAGMNIEIPVFQGSPDGQLIPAVYVSIPSSSMDLSRIYFALAGAFSVNDGSDLALFYNDPVTGGQEIHVLKSESGAFNPPVKQYVSSPSLLLFQEFSMVFGGNFVYEPLITACTWKEDMRGAISFTFDDGALGAFEHGAAELETEGLKGSFFIFTDTAAAYDGDLAEAAVILEYRGKGHEIGSRTHNLSNLGHLTETGDTDSLMQVLSSSKDLLNERFKQQTLSLSIPFGSFRYETSDYISRYFFSARSSQHGFNLASPYDFFALKAWPVLSTTSPAYVSKLLERAENYGYYLPLVYFDMTDEAFDEESMLYTYSRDLFRETLQGISERQVWVDTHERIYKYIRERNAVKIEQLNMGDSDQEPGQFSFVISDGLADSVFNVELTLKIRLPQLWNGESVSIEVGDSLFQAEVLWDPQGNYIYCNSIPVEGRKIQISKEVLSGTGLTDRTFSKGKFTLSAFPNPFTSETQINIEGQINSQMQLFVLDMHGRMLREIAVQGQSSFALDGAYLTPGLYIVLLTEAGVPVKSLKLLVE